MPVTPSVPTIFTFPAKFEVAVVEVASIKATLGVEVDTIRVPSKAVSMWEPIDDALVPPLSTGNTPVTCEVRLICPESVAREIQLFAMAKQPEAKLAPLANVDVAVVELTFKSPTVRPPLNVDVAVVVAFTAPK